MATIPTKEPRLRCSLLRCDVVGRQCLSSCQNQARIGGGLCPDFKSFADLNDEQMVRFIASNLDNLNASAKFAFHDLIVRAKAMKKSGGIYTPPEEKKTMSTETSAEPSLFDKLKALPADASTPPEPKAEASAPATADDTAASQPPAAVSPAPAPASAPAPAAPAPAAAAPAPAAPAATPAPTKRARKTKNEKETPMPRGVYPRKNAAAPATAKPKRASTRKVAAKTGAGPTTATAVPVGGSYIHAIVNGVSTLTATTPKAAKAAVVAKTKLQRVHKKAVSALSKAHAHEPAILAAKVGELATAQAAELAALPQVVTAAIS
jgi:hypothetical protein